MSPSNAEKFGVRPVAAKSAAAISVATKATCQRGHGLERPPFNRACVAWRAPFLAIRALRMRRYSAAVIRLIALPTFLPAIPGLVVQCRCIHYKDTSSSRMRAPGRDRTSPDPASASDNANGKNHRCADRRLPAPRSNRAPRVWHAHGSSIPRRGRACRIEPPTLDHTIGITASAFRTMRTHPDHLRRTGRRSPRPPPSRINVLLIYTNTPLVLV